MRFFLFSTVICLASLFGDAQDRVDCPRLSSGPAVGYWRFDGDLRDASGHGNSTSLPDAAFVPGQQDRAVQLSSETKATVGDRAEFRLAPGLRLECWAKFDDLNAPSYRQIILARKNEYMVRVDPGKEGSRLSFFVYLDGCWEPRVQLEHAAEAGTWYHIIAGWDGKEVWLWANGEYACTPRTGTPVPTDEPLCFGPIAGVLDELRIENPRKTFLRLKDFATESIVLRAGHEEKVTAVIENLGMDAKNVSVELQLPPDVECLSPSKCQFETLSMREEQRVAWTLRAEKQTTASGCIHLSLDNGESVEAPCTLAFLPADLKPVLCLPARDTSRTARTFHVDSMAGSNDNSGLTPDAAWKDFTNINGQTLGPGERLLIKRGSVFNQELVISAAGTKENWAEIGAYGTGARSVIRRNWDIMDRCVQIENPTFLWIRSLTVCYAGKGLMVSYAKDGCEGLVIEDCIAHHIEGLYFPDTHGIPEWRGRYGAPGGGLSGGISVTGGKAPGKNILIRDCEVFQTSNGFRGRGKLSGMTVDRIYCHDNHVYNTSPHPTLAGLCRSFLLNSILDASGYHAAHGTMGIMLVNPRGLIVRNCTFCNQPDSGSHDQGGVDFENLGNGCIIEECTFQNNAGAAIEVLGLQKPQPRNVEIRRNRFIKNNMTKKIGPSEIYIWGKQKNPRVCCSIGSIHDNGYVTHPGVQFFANEAPETTRWELRNNAAYETVADLENAMPCNKPPEVNAGPDLRTDSLTVQLQGAVHDDGKSGAPLKVRWEVLEGPGAVEFDDPSSASATAAFTVSGDYILRLVADDGQLWLSDMCTVHILPRGASVLKAWEFNTPLNKEGWTEMALGTREQKMPGWGRLTTSLPVKYVGGGYYILAIEDSSDAHILSQDDLNIDLSTCGTLVIRMQNHTPATSMRIRFRTAKDAAWDLEKSRNFEVAPNDNGPRQYTVNMADVASWEGRLEQLRIDFASDSPLTGTCRIDYIWLCK